MRVLCDDAHGKGERTRDLEQTSHGRNQQHKLSTSTGVGHKSFTKALGMARGKTAPVETWQRDSTNNVHGKLGHRPRHIARIMESHNIHRWLIAADLREMSGLEGKATFECVERSFNFNRCLRQGSVEAPRLWQMMAAQLLVSVEGTWRQKNMGLLLDFKGEKVHQICSFVWADNFWIMSHSKRNLEQMPRDLTEEAEVGLRS